MERTHRATRRSCVAVAAAIGLLVPASGCGGEEDDYANDPRPPSTIMISARIGDDKISVSPREFGAGPVELIVSNQTEEAQELTLETDEIGGDAPGIEQNSGPINPGDAARLKVDLRSGTYKVAVDGDGIAPAELSVGDERESAQNELLQP
jgi:hypothetical protein